MAIHSRGWAASGPEEYFDRLLDADEDDARVRLASLTAEGASVLSGALARWREVQGAVVASFGEARLQALYDELAALSNLACA